jgi:lipopolysaccharide transport system permease protein
MLLYYDVPPAWSMLALPALVLLTVLLTLGCGMLASALNVKYRDIGVALPVLVQLWMYVSPILYPSRLVPERWRWAYDLNPMVGIVDGFRAALLGGTFNWPAIAASTLITLVLLVYSARVFWRVEKDFSDII